MTLLGQVKEIIVNSSGYECCILISFVEINKSYWCYTLLSDYISPSKSSHNVYVYVEDRDSVQLKVGDKRKLHISVTFVNSLKAISDTQELGLLQPIERSSYTSFKGIVKKIVDNETLVCNVEPFNDLPVKLEMSEINFNLGDRIEFNGEIKIECT